MEHSVQPRTTADLTAFIRHLHLDRTRWPRLWVPALAAAFSVLVVAFGAAGTAVESLFGVNPLVLAALGWAAWTYWHSVAFGRNRMRYLRDPGNAYRKAFFFNVLPGAAFAIQQMWRPLLHTETLLDCFRRGSPPSVPGLLPASGVALCVLATLTLIVSIRSVGAANAAFLAEYVETDRFEPFDQGLYSRGRHPMFWSGVLFSIGLSLWVQTPTAFLLAGLNALYGLVYNRLEDRRLVRVFGTSYRRYMSRVPRHLPLGLPSRGGVEAATGSRALRPAEEL